MNIDYTEYDWREKVGKAVAKEVKAAIDGINEKYQDAIVEYPMTITVDREIFLWDWLLEEQP